MSLRTPRAGQAGDTTFFPPCVGWCLKPWKRRDLVTLRSGQVEDGYRAVINFSIKQPVSEERAGLQGSPVTVIL